VGEQRWFCRDDDEWAAFAERLKLMPCPHCQAVGALVRHGFLYGFDETSPHRKTLRARRVFCSNRHRRPGCGRTFSVWLADKIRRLSLTTRGLLRFLRRVVADGIASAIRASSIRAADRHLSQRTWQRVWRRFDHGQSAIRTALSGRAPPPEMPPLSSRRPEAAHVLAHLQAAFPNVDCPIAAFQQATRRFFV
jgi:hypothetical protein